MGKMKENPRHNVFSFRVADDERDEILAAIPRRKTRQAFILEAVLEKIRRERQAEIDE